MLHRRFARGSEELEALEVLAVLAALEVLAVADEDIRPPAGRDKRDPPAVRFPFPDSARSTRHYVLGIVFQSARC